MQLKPIDNSTSIPRTEASESRTPTTQDGILPTATSSLDGCPQPRSQRLSRDSVAADTTLSARGVGANELVQTLRRLSLQEGYAPVPGGRVLAYENAATPTGQQSIGFKVTKRSGSPSHGPALTSCPNGMLPGLP